MDCILTFQFYLILNVAVGGINGYFPDDVVNGEGSDDKPWKNPSDRANLEFYESVDKWYRSWLENGTMQVDYIRVYAI